MARIFGIFVQLVGLMASGATILTWFGIRPVHLLEIVLGHRLGDYPGALGNPDPLNVWVSRLEAALQSHAYWVFAGGIILIVIGAQIGMRKQSWVTPQQFR